MLWMKLKYNVFQLYSRHSDFIFNIVVQLNSTFFSRGMIKEKKSSSSHFLFLLPGPNPFPEAPEAFWCRRRFRTMTTWMDQWFFLPAQEKHVGAVISLFVCKERRIIMENGESQYGKWTCSACITYKLIVQKWHFGFKFDWNSIQILAKSHYSVPNLIFDCNAGQSDLHIIRSSTLESLMPVLWSQPHQFNLTSRWAANTFWQVLHTSFLVVCPPTSDSLDICG